MRSHVGCLVMSVAGVGGRFSRATGAADEKSCRIMEWVVLEVRGGFVVGIAGLELWLLRGGGLDGGCGIICSPLFYYFRRLHF